MISITSNPPGLKILLVDDSDDDRVLFSATFAKTGLSGNILKIEDGSEAIAFLKALPDRPRSEWPDVVFLDLKMPVQNGFEVLQWIKDQPALHPLRIFVLSGSDDPGDIVRARNLGARDYFVKPIRAETLRKILSPPCSPIDQ
jgi:CheY-like chemotaxis protein